MACVYFVQIVVLKKNYLRALFDWKEMTKASLSLGTRSPNQIMSRLGRKLACLRGSGVCLTL